MNKTEWQLCPKCGGHGEVPNVNVFGKQSPSSVGTKPCDVCHGAKILAPPSNSQDNEILSLKKQLELFDAYKTQVENLTVQNQLLIIADVDQIEEIASLKKQLEEANEENTKLISETLANLKEEVKSHSTTTDSMEAYKIQAGRLAEALEEINEKVTNPASLITIYHIKEIVAKSLKAYNELTTLNKGE